MHNPTTDFEPFRTGDGSLTLQSPSLQERYHSKHGAVHEGVHVFIRSGIEASGKAHVDILEVGLGTGLNLLLTWIRCWEGKGTASYTALEPFPVPEESLLALDHCNELAWPGLQDPFLERMRSTPDEWQPEEGGLRFRRSLRTVQELQEQDAYDLVFFDAFGPRVQPEMWGLDVFQILHRALRSGGMLVTYCAKGIVRRTLMDAGFVVERIAGPPGKSHMLRATKP